jgi:creatinine amidohydrolase/Fe(II)-dependent formamide hydrolase-like protein
MVSHFDEVTEQGSLGFASFSSKEKGRLIFEAAVAGVASNLEAIYDGYVFASP